MNAMGLKLISATQGNSYFNLLIVKSANEQLKK